jgi:hypothetical protein
VSIHSAAGKKSLNCLSKASFQAPGSIKERKVPGGPSGVGALSFGSFSLGKQRK